MTSYEKRFIRSTQDLVKCKKKKKNIFIFIFFFLLIYFYILKKFFLKKKKNNIYNYTFHFTLNTVHNLFNELNDI